MLDRLSRLPRWQLLFLVAIAARAFSFGNPTIHVDEEFYFMTAHAMWDGALPFVDIWDRKPIGLFLVFFPAAGLGLPLGIYAYQAMALACLVATAWLIIRLAERAGWGKGALLGGIAYLLWPNLLNGVGAQSPIFYNLVMVGAAALILAGEGHPRRRALGCGAMALVGLALQIKYSVVFEGIFFGLWLLWQEWRARRAPLPFLNYGAVLVALALLPTAAAFGYYAAIGQTDAFIFTNFTSIQHRNADPMKEALGNIGTLVLILSPIVAMTFGARGQAIGGDAMVRRFLFAWFGVTLLALAMFAPWFDHYGLPLLVPGCICASGFFGNPRFSKRLAPAILVLVALGGQATLLINMRNRGGAADFAGLERAVGKGPGCLYIYSGNSMLYAASDRCRVTRFAFPSSLTRARDSASLGVEQADELNRVLAAKPEVVVMRPPFRGERPEIRAIVLSAMARDYRLTAQVPMGRETISVYKR